MKNPALLNSHLDLYTQISPLIKERLFEFSQVPESEYFYELCFCICTPQSKAKNAFRVQKILTERDFLNNPFDPTPILRKPNRYIRFHNQKSMRLLEAREKFPEILKIIKSDLSNFEKRNWLAQNFKGFGMKESSHFLRNIGYTGLAILDRHILRHLTECGVYEEIPKIKSVKQYFSIEKDFIEFSELIKIPIDELDLLFWASSAGEILK